MDVLRKINTKLVLAASLVVCLGFILSTLLIERQVRRAMIEREQLSNTVISSFLVQRITPAIKFRKPEKVEEEFKALADQKGNALQYAAVFNTESDLFASFAPDTFNTTAIQSTLTRHRAAMAKGEMRVEAHPDYLIMLLPILNDKDNTWLSTLVIGWSLADIQTEIHALVTSMLSVAIPVVILIIACLMLCMRVLVVNPINRISHLANELARGEGDLRRRINYDRQDELRALCDGFNQFIAKVQTALADVTEQSAALTGIARDSSAASSTANSAAQDQCSSLEQMAAAATEMSVSIRNVANHAAEGEVSTNDAHNVASEVQRIIERNRESTGALASEVERAASVIQRVSEDSQQIGRILDVIRGIAEQTNLLALNAAIEAARAGEQGRGFAVVADEVRSLANKTQQSTEEIKVMIHRLQTGSQDAANVMVQGRDKARQGVEHAEQTRDALQRIHSAVTRISRINSEIARATQDQAQTADAISQDIVQLSELSQTSASSAERAAAVGGELSDLIDKTQTTLRRFRV